jgi:hypothetical protein
MSASWWEPSSDAEAAMLQREIGHLAAQLQQQRRRHGGKAKRRAQSANRIFRAETADDRRILAETQGLK